MFDDDLDYMEPEVRYLSGEEVLEWIFEHDNLANDFLRKFNLVDDVSNFGQVYVDMSEVNDFEINVDYFTFDED